MSDESTTHGLTEEDCRAFLEQKVIKKNAEAQLEEFKQRAHETLEPGQELLGIYSVKTEEHERSRLMSVNDAAVALSAEYSEKSIRKILKLITKRSTSRQCLVKRQ